MIPALARGLALAAALVAAAHAAAADGREEGGAKADPAARAAATLAGYDGDGDGRLSPAEFPFEVVFGRIDRDGDGFLSLEEIRLALEEADRKRESRAGGADGASPAPPAPPAGEGGGAKAPPPDRDGERPARGGDRPPAAPAAEEPPARMDAARAREIMEKDPRWNPESRLEGFLAGFDRDPKDGKVQRKEYPGGEGDAIFRKYDRDRDGELDRRELLPLVKEQIADLEKARHRPNRGTFHYLFDLDQDRRVTREEYALLRGPASAFREYDADRDGVVGYDEIRYPERYNGREAASAAPENRSVWDLYDRNGDRRVSLEEFGGSESVFRRLDRNGDGWLTLADG